MTTPKENLTRGDSPTSGDIAEGVLIREFCSGKNGAHGLSTGMAIFEGGANFPCHIHRFSEALTILEGEALITVENRQYRLQALDSIHLPSGVVHGSQNASSGRDLVMHWAFAIAEPWRTFMDKEQDIEDRGPGLPKKGDPEHIARFNSTEVYPLADGTKFRDLFASRFGSKGICGGYGEVQPGTGLSCPPHKLGESNTIVKGPAACQG